MRDFDEIFAIAAGHKGGNAALEALLTKPLSAAALAETSGGRWLSAMARCVFQAGFNWKVIEAKWDGFETAFEGFDPARVAHFHDDDLDRLLRDTRIVRNGAKIASVIENARFVCDLERDHGSAGAFFAGWPNQDYVGLLDLLKLRGARLGGVTGQRALRRMARDGFVLSPDVCARLKAEGIVDFPPGSKRDMRRVQTAFNIWLEQSGRGLTEISQILAFSI
jgi:3-methyladenine DNA glycosylase Tag